MEREEEDGFFFGGDGLGREGEEEDLEGVIPQGPSGNSISFCFRLSEIYFLRNRKNCSAKSAVTLLS